MLNPIRKIYGLALIHQVCEVQTPDCKKTDLYCYYTKGSQQFCQRDENIGCAKTWSDSLITKHKSGNKMADGSELNGFYRPRSALARALYEKHRNDRHLEEYDHNEVREFKVSLLM